MAARSQDSSDPPAVLSAEPPDPRPVTVLAVDDQETFLHAARQLIAATPGFVQVGEAVTGSQALELASDLHPDLVLLDVRMPDMDGVETARRMTANEPDAVVLLISLAEGPDLVDPAAAVGAAGYLRKQDLSVRTLRDFWLAHHASPD